MQAATSCPHGLRLTRGSADELEWEPAPPTARPAGQERAITVPGVATYQVSDGCRVHVSPEPDADEADLQAGLDGPVTAALLQQRGTLPLHLAAVVLGGVAVGFAGPPRTGKSSLACALGERGHLLLTDDLAAVVDGDDGRPALLPGPPVMRIWGGSARQLGWPVDDGHRLKPGVDKYVYERPERFADTPRRLGALYVLVEHPGDEVLVEPLEGFAKFEALYAGATYNREFLDTPDARAWHFGEVCRIAGHVPAFALGLPTRGRPAGDLALTRVAAQVERHATSLRGGH